MMNWAFPAYLLNATLLGVLAQRLVRTLLKPRADTETDEALGTSSKPWQLNGGYKPLAVGCVDCRSGLSGSYGAMSYDRQRRLQKKVSTNLTSMRCAVRP
jgi:general secretion pathway protein E